MLERTTSGSVPRFGLIVHHTDADREWAHERASHVGQLDEALDAAEVNGWTAVEMNDDWARVSPEPAK